MHFGRHAYRHAVQPSSSLVDYVWISEDFLQSTFRRFANSQRRYESRVPGPLEARRRLAKRRNTALAGIAGSGPLDDIACLFGRNGREHMKWTDSRGRKSSAETRDSHFSPSKPSAPPLPFYNENVNPIEFGIPSGWHCAADPPGRASSGQRFEERLQEFGTISGFKEIIRQFKIDLQREPLYSRLMFDRLLSGLGQGELVAEELALFLDDPYLNIPGAGNYLALVEHHVSSGNCLTNRPTSLGAVIRALELGLIAPQELHAIIKAVPGLAQGGKGVRKQNKKLLAELFREMWDAIGRCDIYHHKDLDDATIDAWLEALWENNTHHDLVLAKKILIPTQRIAAIGNQWTPKFIIRWLQTPQQPHFKVDRDYASNLLRGLDADTASGFVIFVTEMLVSSKKRGLLERWKASLTGLQDIQSIVSSAVWTRLLTRPGISQQHQIIIRLWLLRCFSKCLPEGPPWRRASRVTDLAAISLFRLYESAREPKTQDFLSSLMTGIHDLDMPFTGILLLAVDIKAKKSMTKTTRQTLKSLESSDASFSDLFADVHTYNAAAPHFFSTFETMVRRIDVTSPSFVQYGVHLARAGDTKDVWNLIRLLRSHTPLKIALAKSWHPIPDASEKALVRYYPNPRTADCPDPHAALEMINLIAIAFSCSTQISPRRAFELVRWLYTFLLRHGAPVQPALVRALYHAGVVRFRRDGRHVSPTQYDYICDIVTKVEGPEMVKVLMEPFQVGRSLPQSSEKSE